MAPGREVQREGNVMLSNREWVLQTLAHDQPPAVPYNVSLSPPARAALEARYETDDLAETLNLPIRMASVGTLKPLFASPAKYGPTITDEFGVVWSTNEIDRGVPIGPPLEEPTLSGYTMPDPADDARFEGLDAWCRGNREHFRVIWIGDLWERATFMRGMEDLLLDLAAHPAFVEELLRKLTDRILQTMDILAERFDFDAIALSDDYGAQKAMLISPDRWRSLLKGLLAEIFSLARSCGWHTFHHSCGHNTPIIGDLIEIGLGILHPIQPEAMDVFELKRRFGKHLTLCGGLGTQELLPRGTPGKIRDEVRRLKETLGVGGGYILEPGITLQADVPLENMVAFLEEARRRG